MFVHEKKLINIQESLFSWIFHEKLYAWRFIILRMSNNKFIAFSWTPPVCPSVRPKILSSQLLWNYWSNYMYHETWYVDRTSYVVTCMRMGRKFWSPHFCWSYVPWNFENTYKWPCHCNSSETTDPFIMKLGM